MNIPTLETSRLILREWRESDLAGFAAFRMDPEASKHVGSSASIDEAWRMMAYYAGHWHLRGFGLWCVERKDTSQSIGYCGLYYPYVWPEQEVGWGIYPEHQHQGYATEAATASLTYAYETLNWPTAISLIAEGNLPSIALAKRLGARREAPFTYKGVACSIYRHLNPQDFQTHSKEKLKWH